MSSLSTTARGKRDTVVLDRHSQSKLDGRSVSRRTCSRCCQLDQKYLLLGTTPQASTGGSKGARRNFRGSLLEEVRTRCSDRRYLWMSIQECIPFLLRGRTYCVLQVCTASCRSLRLDGMSREGDSPWAIRQSQACPRTDVRCLAPTSLR